MFIPLQFFKSVEGTWSSWDPWGTCSGLCDSNATHSRMRNFTGGTIPCNGSDIETGSCKGEYNLINYGN